MNKLNNPLLFHSLKIIIAIIFVFAGMNKIANPEHFAQSIENYKIAPFFMINFIAVFLPWLEVIIGILLLWNKNIQENLLVINILLWIFTLLVLSALLRGLNIDCGCFGTVNGTKVGLAKIAENLVLISIGLYLQYSSKYYIVGK